MTGAVLLGTAAIICGTVFFILLVANDIDDDDGIQEPEELPDPYLAELRMALATGRESPSFYDKRGAPVVGISPDRASAGGCSPNPVAGQPFQKTINVHGREA